MHPYKLRLTGHQSATSLNDYSECELKGAYARNFEDVPEQPRPVPLIGGTAYHYLIERFGPFFWKKAQENKGFMPSDVGKKIPSYGFAFLMNVLKGKHGPRGEKDSPVEIAFKTPSLQNWPSEKHYLANLEQEHKQYAGTAYLVLEALRQQFTQPLTIFGESVVGIEFESGFGGDDTDLAQLELDLGIRLKGAVDLIEITPRAYYATDFKSGWITQSFKDRTKLVRNIQMTVYALVLSKRYGRLPEGLFIQPLNFSKQHLLEHGPNALRQLRIQLPPRNASHFEDLGKLANDVREMLERVVNHHHFSQQQRQDWQPKSSYAQKAGFAESVVQGRFVPRVGPWCEHCRFVALCKEDHREDWHLHRAQKENLPHSEAKTPLVKILPLPQPEPQGRLFEEPKQRKHPYAPKAIKQLRNEMVASGHFIPFRGIKSPVTNRMRKMLGCLCVDERVKLWPKWFSEFIGVFQNPKHGVDLGCLAENCPFGGCPARANKEKGNADSAA